MPGTGWGPGGRRFKSCLPDFGSQVQTLRFARRIGGLERSPTAHVPGARPAHDWPGRRTRRACGRSLCTTKTRRSSCAVYPGCMSQELRGTVAAVTAASSQIGEATRVRWPPTGGATVSVAARRNSARHRDRRAGIAGGARGDRADVPSADRVTARSDHRSACARHHEELPVLHSDRRPAGGRRRGRMRPERSKTNSFGLSGSKAPSSGRRARCALTADAQAPKRHRSLVGGPVCE